ncbi:hypothetical protein HAX54_003989 [Datura stramonium]|uniref:Uncharacterized protein n=1 Tax=Datura stramonium TaxID=4076 RepID=A0ABS8WV07_DATST|nr:hypothetical protein [Datura stramonium]
MDVTRSLPSSVKVVILLERLWIKQFSITGGHCIAQSVAKLATLKQEWRVNKMLDPATNDTIDAKGRLKDQLYPDDIVRNPLMDTRNSAQEREGAWQEAGSQLLNQPQNVSKIKWLGETEEAYRSLAKAVEILRISHGTNTAFMKELFVKLEEARAELSYKISSKE